MAPEKLNIKLSQASAIVHKYKHPSVHFATMIRRHVLQQPTHAKLH